jgi:hypothetical protein
VHYTVIALRPVLWPQPVAASHYKYLVVVAGLSPGSIQNALDKQVSEGWELSAAFQSDEHDVKLIFRKAD